MSSANGKSRTPSAVHRIEVALKSGFPDSAGASILAQLPLLGVQTVSEVQVSQVYEITGPLTPTQVAHAAQGLLADPILQDYFIGARRAESNGVPCWRIEVWLKPSVSDPTGDSVRKAVVDLGLPAPERARVGTAYRLKGRLGQAQAEKIAARLLANPVVHRFSVVQA